MKNFVMPIKAFLSVVIPVILALLTVGILSLGISLITPVTYSDVISFPFTVVFGVIVAIVYLYITADWLLD